MSYWSGLYSLEFEGKLADSINVLMGVAYKLLAQQVAPSIAGQTGRTAQARFWLGTAGMGSIPCRAVLAHVLTSRPGHGSWRP